MVYDAEKRIGYAFKGSAELLASGALYDQTVEALKKAAPQLPPAKYAVKVTVDAIFNQSAGPEGGKKIA